MLKLALHFLSCIFWSYMPLGMVRRMQLRKFREVFEYAREHSRFYHDLYERMGILDLKIRTWDDVGKVPVVTKQMLRQAKTEDLMAQSFDSSKHVYLTTSGSSGTPFKIVYDKWVAYTGHVRFVLIMMRHGYTPFKKLTWICRYSSVGDKLGVEENNKFVTRLQWAIGAFRRELISVFTPIDEMISKLKAQKPYVLWTTVSAANLVALELSRRNEKLEIPLLVLYAETHTFDQIQLFKERISPNVIDNYGSEEFPSMAESYNQDSYKRVFSNFVLTEVANQKDVGAERVGDLIVTNFLNKAMPFIRYNLGDYVGVLDGADFPSRKIGKVYGRVDDIIRLPSGDDIYFYRVYKLFTDFDLVDQYKVYQRKNGKLEFWMRLKEGGARERCHCRSRKTLGERMARGRGEICHKGEYAD